MTQTHLFITVSHKDRVFTDRSCDIRFDPIMGKPIRSGFDMSIYVIVHEMVYGYFSGKCTIEDGKKIREIRIDKVLGTVEHFRARF